MTRERFHYVIRGHQPSSVQDGTLMTRTDRKQIKQGVHAHSRHVEIDSAPGPLVESMSNRKLEEYRLPLAHYECPKRHVVATVLVRPPKTWRRGTLGCKETATRRD